MNTCVRVLMRLWALLVGNGAAHGLPVGGLFDELIIDWLVHAMPCNRFTFTNSMLRFLYKHDCTFFQRIRGRCFGVSFAMLCRCPHLLHAAAACLCVATTGDDVVVGSLFGLLSPDSSPPLISASLGMSAIDAVEGGPWLLL